MTYWYAVITLGGFAAVLYTAYTFQNLQFSEDEAKIFLEELNQQYAEDEHRQTVAHWIFQTNMTDERSHIQAVVESEIAETRKKAWIELQKFDWRQFSNYSLKRQFQMYSVLHIDVLPKNKIKNLTKIIDKLQNYYGTAQICPKDAKDGDDCTLHLEPEISDIFARSRDPEELKHVWVKIRDAIGSKCRPLYQQYVELVNEAANLNNLCDYSELWLNVYEDPDFKFKVEALWDELKPLYQQLHAYIRVKLRERYGDIVSTQGPIPVHLLGNMWGQSWTNIADFTMPYPEMHEHTDLGKKLKEQNYTVTKIYETADNFYKSINMSEMPKYFWERSILVKPKNVDMICQAGSWDFSDGEDFRISHCAEVTAKNFVTAHHELGHIKYFLQYKDQPILFRQGANDGFHEAIGDLIALSVQSSKHLQRLGFQEKGNKDPKLLLNELFKLGLYQIPFLPFSYLTDLWRWDVFSGKITPQTYNCKWWELREKYQGVEPPVERSENDFDPASKYHIIDDTPYLRYFISMVLQYQFHKALCIVAGEYEENNPQKELHNCDIYGSAKAGNLLKKMLSMGASRPWPDALEVITGHREMHAYGLLEYFKPLQEWLEKTNRKNGAFIGWTSKKKGNII